MIGVDVGGTFTDIVAIEGGQVVAHKVATDAVEADRAVVAGTRKVDLAGAASFNHASTHGLNAILTRRLPKIAFLATEGHRDMLDMAQSWGPVEALTDAHWRRTFGDARDPIVPRYLRRGIRERMTSEGAVHVALDEEQARRQLRVLAECEVRGVAICLLNAYVNGAHEERLRELVAEELGEDVACSISSRVSPLAREYARASTTVVDVAMKIVYGPYAHRLDRGLRDAGFGGELRFADCAATLAPTDFALETPSRIVFSGPAAGTIASAHFGRLIGVSDLLCADVGGTSCDLSVVRNDEPTVRSTFELEHDLIVNTLSNEIHAVGAGGGSIVSVTATGEVRVGPESAGADPGPACYGRGGTQPTTTDACLLIGVLDAERFASGRLDRDRAWEAFAALDHPDPVPARISAAYRLAVNNVAEGVFGVIVKAGIDPRDFSLIAYGAAGPMLLPAALDQVGVKSIIVPPNAGLFSALGLLSADQVFVDSRSAYTPLTPDAAGSIDAVYQAMEEGLRSRLGADGDAATFARSFDGQLMGQAWDTPFIPVPGGTIGPAEVEQMIANFHDAYETQSGNRFEFIPVQGVTYRVRAVVPTDKVDYPPMPPRNGTPLAPRRTIALHFLEEVPVEAAEYERVDLRAGDSFVGPAIVREPLGTTHLHRGQVGVVGDRGEITITSREETR